MSSVIDLIIFSPLIRFDSLHHQKKEKESPHMRINAYKNWDIVDISAHLSPPQPCARSNNVSTDGFWAVREMRAACACIISENDDNAMKLKPIYHEDKRLFMDFSTHNNHTLPYGQMRNTYIHFRPRNE